MTEHTHERDGDCPNCKKVGELEKKLFAILETSGLDPRDIAYSLILFAAAWLLEDYGLEGSKRIFMELATRRFAEFEVEGIGAT